MKTALQSDKNGKTETGSYIQNAQFQYFINKQNRI
jgi:hypothetical protein